MKVGAFFLRSINMSRMIFLIVLQHVPDILPLNSNKNKNKEVYRQCKSIFKSFYRGLSDSKGRSDKYSGSSAFALQATEPRWT